MIVRIIGRFISACVIALAIQAQAQTPAPAQTPPPPTALRVITFDGGWNLPLWAAQRQGFFEAQGLAVQLSYTPTSVFLVTAVLEGRADIVTSQRIIARRAAQVGLPVEIEAPA